MTLKTKKTNAELDAQAMQLDESKEASGAVPLHILPSPSEPMAVAREFVESRCLFGDHLTLHYWRGGWWTWRTAHWAEVDDRTVMSTLYKYTEHAVYFVKLGSELINFLALTIRS